MAGNCPPGSRAQGRAFAGRVRRNHQMVVGLHSMPEFEHFLLNGVQFGGGQSCRREYWLSPVLCDADENVAAAQVVKLVCEGAYREEDGLRENQIILRRRFR
jgi:hypothetical protein